MTLTAGLTWPSIARTPRAPLASAVARPIFGRAIRLLPVRARYPDGVAVSGRHATDGSPVFELVRPSAFFARLGKDTKIGFGEAYMAGDWKTGAGTDLADLLTPFAARLTSLVPPPLQRLRRSWTSRQPAHEENTLEGSRGTSAPTTTSPTSCSRRSSTRR